MSNENLPLRAINQVVFNGNEGFEDCQTTLLLQPEKTWNYSFIYHESEDAAIIKSNAEFCVDRCLPEAAPLDYVLLAINPNGEPKSEAARQKGFRAYYFLFVEEGAFEFREKSPEDFRPQKLEIKILENGLRFYSDATYLIWNEEAAVPPEIENAEWHQKFSEDSAAFDDANPQNHVEARQVGEPLLSGEHYREPNCTCNRNAFLGRGDCGHFRSCPLYTKFI